MSYKMIRWESSSNDKEYFMDVNAFMETRNKARNEGFHHSCHDHLLELKEVFLDSINEVICNGCYLFIRGPAYYTCTTPDCDFHLHELCAHLPQKNMIHLIHDENIHKLITLTKFASGYFFHKSCNICHERLYSYNRSDPETRSTMHMKDIIYYQCGEEYCKFLVDFKCVASVFAVKDPDHRHALTPHMYPASFICSICGEKNDDNASLSYLCHECPFWVHDTCYPLPRTIQHGSHPHPLRTIHPPPSPTTFLAKHNLAKDCGICQKKIFVELYWFYECVSCSYKIHVKCSFKERIEMVLPKLDEEKVKSMIKLSFPNKESVHQTLNQLVRKLCKTEEEEESSSDHKLLHHSNHGCQLMLYEMKINNNGDNNQVCDACKLPICEPPFYEPFYECLGYSCKFFLHKWCAVCDACVLPICEPPFYACIGDNCKFSFHKWCANLPKEWKFTHHDDPEHTFVLMEKKIDEFDFHRCGMCKKVGNGFFFKCTECIDYYIDIKCASLPNFVMHETHDHPLHLLRKREHIATRNGTCYCCIDEDMSKCEIVYACVSCHVFLHVGCLWIPQKMEHWYEEHPFSLVYMWPHPISGDGSDDYFCEFCEISIKDEHWFYHCSKCDRSSHIQCIGRDLYPMLKFGNCYALNSIHEHPVTCVRVRTIYAKENIVKRREFMMKLANVGLELGSLCLDSKFCSGRDHVWATTVGWEEMIFECLICKIVLHPECVEEALQPVREIARVIKRTRELQREMERYRDRERERERKREGERERER